MSPWWWLLLCSAVVVTLATQHAAANPVTVESASDGVSERVGDGVSERVSERDSEVYLSQHETLMLLKYLLLERHHVSRDNTPSTVALFSRVQDPFTCDTFTHEFTEGDYMMINNILHQVENVIDSNTLQYYCNQMNEELSFDDSNVQFTVEELLNIYEHFIQVFQCRYMYNGGTVEIKRLSLTTRSLYHQAVDVLKKMNEQEAHRKATGATMAHTSWQKFSYGILNTSVFGIDLAISDPSSFAHDLFPLVPFTTLQELHAVPGLVAPDGDVFKYIIQDAHYESYWERAHRQQRYYHGSFVYFLSNDYSFSAYDGIKEVMNHHIPKYSVERQQHIFNLLVLSKVTRLPAVMFHFDQILEYGGGTGDTAVTCRQLGFRGRHLIYDLRPSLLVQQMFLRSHGWPTYFVDLMDNEQLSRDQSLYLGRKTLMVPADLSGEVLAKAVSDDRVILKKSLFIATFSLSESPLPDREKVLTSIKGFAVMLIRFAPTYDSIDNVQYFSEFANKLNNEYVTCMFGNVLGDETDHGGTPTKKYEIQHYTFVAMRKDVSPRGLWCDMDDPKFQDMMTRNG